MSDEQTATQPQQPPLREVTPEEVTMTILNALYDEQKASTQLLAELLKEQRQGNQLLAELLKLVQGNSYQSGGKAASLDSIVNSLLRR